jgi:hypothetical protein
MIERRIGTGWRARFRRGTQAGEAGAVKSRSWRDEIGTDFFSLLLRHASAWLNIPTIGDDLSCVP